MNAEKVARLEALLNSFSQQSQKELRTRIDAYASKFGTDQALEIWLPVLEGAKPPAPVCAHKFSFRSYPDCSTCPRTLPSQKKGAKPCQDAGAPLLASGHTATLL